ncbi:MAG: hypothetical protein R2830_09675 [Saprospiraceae bacterium]
MSYSTDAKDRRKNNPDVKSGLFLKNPSIAGVFKIKMVKLFFIVTKGANPAIGIGRHVDEVRF